MLHRVVSQRIPVSFSLLAVLAIAIFSAGTAYAQVSGATLSGTITDPSGAAIAGAKVSIANKATGVTRDVTTDAAGLYSAPNLLPGVYDVTASASGFSAAKQADVTLTVGAQQTLNLPLKIGEATQTVEVTGAATQVQVSNSVLSNEIESNTVRELPLNGRDWASLATLSPGVNAIESQMPFENGAIRGNRGFGAQLTISGGRPTQNNYRLDGNSINDYANGGPGSVLGVSLGVDAIAEFSVLTGNYSAEYGRTSGGVVNAISKSGTNGFHGDLYEFLRNDKLDANDFFFNAANQARPPYRRNQFGAAVGGPIRKDKTFFFFDYEGIRQSQVNAIPTQVPSDAARAGHLANGTTVTVDPAVQKFLALYPHANGPVNGNIGVFLPTGAQTVTENFYTSRVDHKISDKDSLFGTYMYDKTPYNQQDSFGNTSVLDQTIRHIGALEETHVFSPSLVNSVRGGYNRNAVINYQTVAAINPASADNSLGAFPNSSNPSTRIGGGFTILPAGLNNPGFSHHDWNSFQFYDDAFLTRGTHSLKFGFALERMDYNFFQAYNPEGIWRFNSLSDFLTNQPHSLEGGLPGRDTPRGLRQTLFGGYIQDDWKVLHNLTLNVGLRYEMATVLNEVQGKLTNLRRITDPVPYCGATANTDIFGTPGCTGAAPYYSNPTTLNFEPRFGFAWDPRGDGKTAVRGGFAIFDVLPLPGYFYTQQGIQTPFFLDGTASSTPAAPLAGIGVLAATPGSAFSKLGVHSLTAAFMDPNPKRNYVEQWNINVQRQVTSSLTATVGYVGSHGVHMLMRGDDANMVIPTQISPGQYLWPYNPTQKDLRINPNFGAIRYMFFGSSATYSALVFNVQKRMSHGFQFGGSYTYSKAMDDNSSTIAGDAFSNSITSWFWFAPQISHSVSDFNITHTASVNAIWDVPGPRTGFARGVLGGWEMGSIFKMNSGIPTTPLIGGDPMGVQNNGSDVFGIPSIIPGCDPVNHNYKSNPGGVFLGYVNYKCFTVPMASAVPSALASQCVPFSKVPGSCSNLLGNAGRNSIIGPSLVNLDFSLYKNIAVKKISEAFNVQFRAEVFNILNHPNFSPPLPFFGSHNAELFGPDGTSNNAGGLQTTVTQPRQIQFAIKVIF